MRRWFGIALFAAALLGSACTGGDDGNATAGSTTTATDGAPSATATGAPSEPATPGEPSEAEQFQGILGALDRAEYTIRYELVSTFDGQRLIGELRWVRAADGRERFETSGEQGGQQFRLIVITDAAGVETTCFNFGGFMECLDSNSSPVGDIPNPAEIIFSNIRDPERIAGVTHVESRTILGVEAECYRFTEGGVTSEACVDPENLLLYAEYADANGDGGSMEALELSASADDSEFEIPA